MPKCLIGLGANLGDRQQTLARAVTGLESIPQSQLLACSRWHATPPIGGPAGQDDFLNGAALLDSQLAPAAVAEALHDIEAQLGRRRVQRWAARPLDLDLLLYDDAIIDTPDLVVPHPSMGFRRFVLAPAAEVAAAMRHPQFLWTVGELLAHLDRAPPYLALAGVPMSAKQHIATAVAARFGGRVLSSPDTHAADEPFASAAPGPLVAQELELLAERAQLLSAAAWPAEVPLTVSDFWLEQSLAVAEAADSQAELAALAAAWKACRRLAAPAKLRVLLWSQKVPDGAQPLAFALDNLANRGSLGPVLKLCVDDQAAAIDELAAAVEAMA